MCERTDLEIRIYLTGRPDGSIEWQVTHLEADGQVVWVDGDVSPYRAMRSLVPGALSQAISGAVRHLCFQLRSSVRG